MHHHRQQKAEGIHANMPRAPVHLLVHVVAPDPPLSVALTLCESMIAAEGVGSRPAAPRTRSRSVAFIVSQTPARRQSRN